MHVHQEIMSMSSKVSPIAQITRCLSVALVVGHISELSKVNACLMQASIFKQSPK